MNETIEDLIERVVKAAEDFKQKPMKPESRKRIKRLLRKFCEVQPDLGL